MVNVLLWGIFLWFVGYILGILLFAFIPPSQIGWFIAPIGATITFWVLFKKIKSKYLKYYFLISVIWTLIAVVFDYFFIVKLFKSTNYYKPDVYFYYLVTFLLPIFVGYRKIIK
jgi:hypothetical protein